MNIVVTGGSNGLGKAIVDIFAGDFSNNVFNFDIDFTNNILSEGSNITNVYCDVSNEEMVHEKTSTYYWEQQGWGNADILINCAGVNSQDYLEDSKISDWDRVMGVNAKGIYLMSRGLLQHLAEPGGTILNIISNASHIPMTASAAYNASKGAAHILTQQLARELTKMHDVTVFGISPAKLRGTKMSQVIESEVCRVRGWTPEQAAEYQKGSLLTGEIDPATLAEFIEWLLIDKEHHRHFSGCVIPYGA